MAWSLQEELRAKREATERWMRQREADLRRSARELEARGRKVYADAIKTGQQVLARTPAEVRQLGLAAVTGRLPQAVAETVVRKATPKVRAAARETVKFAKSVTSPEPQVREQALREAAENAGAAVREVQGNAGAAFRGAVDEFTLGLADRGTSAVEALASGGPSGFRERYRAEMLEKRAEDAADEAQYGLARNSGRVLGFGASLLATGVGSAVVRSAPRVARIVKAANKVRRLAPMPPGGLNTLTAAGGASAGVGGQFVTDLATGHRSGASDYLAAGLGGTLGAFAMRAGAGPRSGAISRAVGAPPVAGAVEGASTEALKATFEGRPVGFVDVAEAGRAGAVGARLGDVVGKYGSNALPTGAKGQLGEILTVLRSRAAGEGEPILGRASADFERLLPGAVQGPGLQRKIKLSEGHTVADYIAPNGRAYEAKFGSRPM